MIFKLFINELIFTVLTMIAQKWVHNHPKEKPPAKGFSKLNSNFENLMLYICSR